MSDLISRQAAIDELWGIQRRLQMIDASEGADKTIHGVQLSLHKIEHLPSAYPKNGKWIVKGQEVFCSVCGEESAYTWHGSSKFSNYCPNCGARMDEDD